MDPDLAVKILFSFALLLACYQAFSLTNETNRLGPTAGLRDVAYGAGKYVAISGDSRLAGSVVVSSNALDWFVHDMDIISDLRAITFANDLFVAVGGPYYESSLIVTSGDGIGWSVALLRTGRVLFDVAYGDGIYVAVGGSGAIFTSPDGANWTERASGTLNTFKAVAYGAGCFVALTSAGELFRSCDAGVTWERRTLDTTITLQWEAVTYGDGWFVAGGRQGCCAGMLYKSQDGATWAEIPGQTDQAVNGLAFGGGTFVAVRDYSFIRSTDLANWPQISFDPVVRAEEVSFGNGLFVAVGAGSRIVTSADLGQTWSLLPILPEIIIQPQDVVFNAPAGGVQFTVTAAGVPAPVYQWQLNGDNLPGQSSPYLSLPASSIPPFDSEVRVILSNTAGSVTSRVARLILNASPPQFRVEPTSRTGFVGDTIVLSAEAFGFPAPSYQWLKNGAPFPSGMQSILVLENVTPGDSGAYSLVLSNTAGSITSAPVQVVVTSSVPFFTLHPSNTVAIAGSVATLTAEAKGPRPMVYQWRRNGAPFGDATSDAFLSINADESAAGDYDVIASNEEGSTVSEIARLTVEPMAILSHPFPAYTTSGGSAWFNVIVSGFATPTFQWHVNGVPYPPQASSQFYLTNVNPAHAGQVSVVISNVYGAVTSAPAALGVNQMAPAFPFNPGPQQVSMLQGQSFQFGSLATAWPPPAYQWLLNGQRLPGRTSASIFVSSLTSADQGLYSLIASNLHGAATNHLVQLTVVTATPPVMVSHPVDMLAGAGEMVFFNGFATGLPSPRYQWQRNGVNIPSGTNAGLEVVASVANEGAYRLIASNASGSVTSRVAFLTVLLNAPHFYSIPPEQVVPLGQSFTLTVGVFGAPAPHVQWQLNGVDIPGKTNVDLDFSNVQPRDVGCYTLVASNIAGVATSPPINLRIAYLPPVIVWQSGDLSVLAGETASFMVSAQGGPVPNLQWYHNGEAIPGQIGQELDVINVAPEDAGEYFVVARNVFGAVTSRVSRLTVRLQLPQFFQHPVNQTVVEGSSVTFTAGATGGPPPSYHLLRNNQPVPIPYQPGFTLLEVSTNDAGSYAIVASNIVGSVTSLVATLTVIPSGPLDHWHRRNPLPQGNPLLAIAHGDGLFVAVGENGSIVTSSNAIHWTLQPLRTESDLYGVAHGNGLFVAVGDGGTILTSSNGSLWDFQYSQPQLELRGIAFGNGAFVAVGSLYGNSVALRSEDGHNWDYSSLPFSTRLNDIAFGGELFVVVTTSDRIFTSSDGIFWSVRRLVTGYTLEGITHGNGLFVAVGDNGRVVTSSDSGNWVERSANTERRLLDVVYGNGRFLAVGTRGVLFSSPDAITWQPQISGTPDRLESIIFAENTFVAVGENGTTITSSDGNNWTKRNSGPTRDLDGMTVGDGQIVVVGKFGTIVTSRDGQRYFEQISGVTNDLHGITYAAGLYVAVGEGGIVLTSSNGVAWLPRDTGINSSLKAVAYGGGVWIAVGTGQTILRSLDAQTWSQATPPGFTDLNSVAFGNGTFVVVGDSGTIFVSPDGSAWQSRFVATGKNLRGVTFGNGIFLISANDGQLFLSTDAVSWPGRYAGQIFNDYDNLRDAWYGEGMWVLVGNRGIILTSTNLTQFRRHPSRTLENLHGIRNINGTFVAIGNRGTILQSDRLYGPVLRVRTFDPRVGFEFSINSQPGQRHLLQASEDLINWSDIFEFQNNQATTIYTDEDATWLPKRFYRIR